jgi:predicted aldo/keto reductase-like oxidoreductase
LGAAWQALKGGVREKVELATKFGVKIVDEKREVLLKINHRLSLSRIFSRVF